jgi:hypothetical protein
MKSLTFVFLMLSFSLTACGGDGDSSQSNSGVDPQQDNQQVAKTTSCGNQTCDNSTQYCFKELKVGDSTGQNNSTNITTTVVYSTCMSLPSSCAGCDCAQKDAMAQESGSCQGFVGCDQTDTQNNNDSSNSISVSCYQ